MLLPWIDCLMKTCAPTARSPRGPLRPKASQSKSSGRLMPGFREHPHSSRPQARGEHHQGPWPQAEREVTSAITKAKLERHHAAGDGGCRQVPISSWLRDLSFRGPQRYPVRSRSSRATCLPPGPASSAEPGPSHHDGPQCARGALRQRLGRMCGDVAVHGWRGGNHLDADPTGVIPATSSPDAELHGISRACREAIFVHDLAVLDVGQEWRSHAYGLTAPRVSQQPSASVQGASFATLTCPSFTSKVQFRQGLAKEGEGHRESGEYLTKSPRLGTKCCKLCSPWRGRPDAGAGDTARETHSVKLVRENPPSQWKPVFLCTSLAIASATIGHQILAVRGQPREEEIIEWALRATHPLVCHRYSATVVQPRAATKGEALRRQPEEEPSEATSEPEEEADTPLATSGRGDPASKHATRGC